MSHIRTEVSSNGGFRNNYSGIEKSFAERDIKMALLFKGIQEKIQKLDEEDRSFKYVLSP